MKNKFSIDVDNSINSGQVFLWEKHGSDWYGIDGQDVLKINKNGVIKSIRNLKTDFFRKNDNIEEIIKSISKDKTVKKAVKEYEGLRLFRQDPFQCLISFIISSNSNIQKIKSSLEKITKKFGKKVKIQNKEFFLFPEPEKMAKATIDEIKSCGVG
ncbi:DNA repair protein, partial [Nitrosopumilus sp.]|nr:DNA repair protein [Nitrosopumilus sp.]